MSHMEDDDPPIKSHPASKEYRDNFDRIFGTPVCVGPAVIDKVMTERPAQERPEECSTCGAKEGATCDTSIHETTGYPIER